MPSSDRRPVPYYSQLSNETSPFGTCNLTSLAMVLEYLGAKQKTTLRFPDELIEFCESKNLDRHEVATLVEVAADYGQVDSFQSRATIAQIKAWLASPKLRAVVLHGYFTASGHIIAVTGYDDDGFWVNDPYGEWTADGYDRNTDEDPTKGKQLNYSYGMISRSCDDAELGGIWAHFLGRAGDIPSPA